MSYIKGYEVKQRWSRIKRKYLNDGEKFNFEFKLNKNIVPILGLHLIEGCKGGQELCKASGYLSDNFDIGIELQVFAWQVKKSLYLILDDKSIGNPGNGANTSSGGTNPKNNAKMTYCHKGQNKNFVTLFATKDIAPGEEILIPYGKGFTGKIRKA
jgi:hypothetical protein